MINIYTQDGRRQSWQLLYNLNLLEVRSFDKLHYGDPAFKDPQTTGNSCSSSPWFRCCTYFNCLWYGVETRKGGFVEQILNILANQPNCESNPNEHFHHNVWTSFAASPREKTIFGLYFLTQVMLRPDIWMMWFSSCGARTDRGSTCTDQCKIHALVEF